MPDSLGILERGYRGGLEKQFFDSLYLSIELHRQLGGLDLLLRGTAAPYAVEVQPMSLQQRDRTVEGTDYSAAISNLIAAGVRVTVEREALEVCGLAATARLAGVDVCDADETAKRWPEYRWVFFL